MILEKLPLKNFIKKSWTLIFSWNSASNGHMLKITALGYSLQQGMQEWKYLRSAIYHLYLLLIYCHIINKNSKFTINILRIIPRGNSGPIQLYSFRADRGVFGGRGVLGIIDWEGITLFPSSFAGCITIFGLSSPPSYTWKYSY